ncbi:expressed unknown protein [Seminavis robusta]|uniref:Transmembrane protein n=1 Tax=Seminavis robusta TaxID=568900 RepID=A0A9N8E0Q7_9STRA|nr:expressed unknown protein [Seminavis robusta]|eukprot:Sro508_g156870.1 n/a (258) ;mRNA; r:50163-50936
MSNISMTASLILSLWLMEAGAFTIVSIPPTRSPFRSVGGSDKVTTSSSPPLIMTTRRTRKGSSPAVGMASKKQSNDDKVLLFSLLDKVGKIATSPTPFLDNLPLGYPLAMLLLVATNLLDPVSTVLFVLLFGTFRFVGGTFQEDEEDDPSDSPPIDLLAFVAALLSSLLLAPSDITTTTIIVDNTTSGIGAVQIGGIIAAVTLVAGSTLLSSDDEEAKIPPKVPKSAEQERMDQWDDEFRRAATAAPKEDQSKHDKE